MQNSIIGLLLLAGCATSDTSNHAKDQLLTLDHINDAEVKEIMLQAIDAGGGLDRWNAWTQLSFDKHTILYDSLGHEELNRKQRIIWQRSPVEQVNIAWNQEDEEHQLSWQSGEIKKYVAGKEVKVNDSAPLLNSVLSATYVMSLPFKLLEKNYDIKSQGQKTVQDRKATILQSQYLPPTPNETVDTWWLHFDEDFRLIGYQVAHADHISLVENSELIEAGGILWPLTRKSWRVNKHGEKLWLRAAYSYGNYQVLP